MDDGTKREWFWRINDNEMWAAGRNLDYRSQTLFMPFIEIISSIAPHIIIERPHRPMTLPAPGTKLLGKHVLINDSVLDHIRLWQKSPNFGGMTTLREFLDACYA